MTQNNSNRDRRTFGQNLLSWVIPTILTAIVAITAAGVQVSVKTNQQNTELLFQELNKVRIERQHLNDELYKIKKEKERLSK